MSNNIKRKIRKNLKLLIFVLFYTVFFSRVSYGLNWLEAHKKEYAMDYSKSLELKKSTNTEDIYTAALKMLSERYDKRAEKLFRRMEDIGGPSFGSRWGIAEIKRRRDREEESKKILDEIISNNPGYAPALISRAYISFEQGSYDEAIDTADKVLDMAPENADTGNIIRAHLIIGGAKGIKARESFIFSKITRGLSARGHLKDAREINPQDPGVVFAWGSYYLEAPGIAGGDIEKAEEYLLKAKEMSPRDTDIYVRLAQLYRKKGNTKLYKKYIEQARGMDPKNRLLKKVLKQEKYDRK